MLSTTVDARVRGDEANCNQLSQYRALRTARSLRDHLLKDDFEMYDVAALLVSYYCTYISLLRLLLFLAEETTRILVSESNRRSH